MKIFLTVTSLASADGEEQAVTQDANGFLRVYDGYLELSYREAGGEEGLGNTLTVLRLYPAYMELIRRGDYACVMRLESGHTHDCLYETPFGSLTLTVATSRYHSSVTPDGHGTVSVHYTLNGDVAYTLTVTVTPSP